MLKLNEVYDSSTQRHAATDAFLVAVNTASETELATTDTGDSFTGALFGETPTGNGNRIRLDQGLDTSEISPARTLDPLLVETQYMIELDNRLGSIVSQSGTKASVSFVDDDNIASYFLSLGTDTELVNEITNTSADTSMTIAGPRGTKLVFKVQSSLELNTSDYFFDTLGEAEDIANCVNGTVSFKQIRSTIRVTGVNTGYRVDVPVRFVKKA
tara:strand:- start:62 stop:703 length:642 start_codon:yes stop_codon:yes gene_type:complete